MSLDAVPTCRDSSWMSPGVARSLSPLAPCLAPRNWLASLMFGWMAPGCRGAPRTRPKIIGVSSR